MKKICCSLDMSLYVTIFLIQFCTVVVQPEEEKTPGRSCSNLPVLIGHLEERWGQTFQQGLLQQDKGEWF